MVALYKDPQGDTVFNTPPSQSTQGYGRGASQLPGNSSDGNAHSEIGTLRKRVLELEQTVSQLKV